MRRGKIRVLELGGTPYEMGFRHGQLHAEAIRHYARERVRLSGLPGWTGRSVSEADVLETARECVDEHRAYAPDLVAELEGMAAATGLSLAELVIVNGFTDFVDVIHNSGRGTAAGQVPVAADNCTAFLVPASRTAAGRALFGQTWDMHDSATEHVLMLRGRPEGKPAFLAFTTAGCVGMIGMNEAGLSVGINNLLGGDGRPGVTWPFVVRRILEQETLEEALACLREARLAGAHNYLLLDAEGRGANVEATSTTLHVSELAADPIAHTNHCLAAETCAVERRREKASRESSEARLQHAEELLSGNGITPDDLKELTRDERAICITPVGPDEIATSGAIVMEPATRELWAVWGVPNRNSYERFSLAPGAA